MDLSVSSAELFGLALAVIVSGAVSGLLAGIFGVGGGAVVVPVLYQGLTILGVDEAVRMHVSLGTSIAVIAPTSIRSFAAHRMRGAVDMELLRGWIVWVPLGVIAATVVAASISSATLRGVFAGLVTIIGLRLLINRPTWRLGEELPGNPARAIVGLLIGFFSALMGIGGGVLNNTFMTLFGRSMHEAVATSSGVGVLISLPAVLGYMCVPVSVLVAPLGVRLAHALSRRQLEIGFGLFLLVVAARFAWTLL
jgi:uncharacterized membrane protein YfcA